MMPGPDGLGNPADAAGRPTERTAQEPPLEAPEEPPDQFKVVRRGNDPQDSRRTLVNPDLFGDNDQTIVDERRTTPQKTSARHTEGGRCSRWLPRGALTVGRTGLRACPPTRSRCSSGSRTGRPSPPPRRR